MRGVLRLSLTRCRPLYSFSLTSHSGVAGGSRPANTQLEGNLVVAGLLGRLMEGFLLDPGGLVIMKGVEGLFGHHDQGSTPAERTHQILYGTGAGPAVAGPAVQTPPPDSWLTSATSRSSAG